MIKEYKSKLLANKSTITISDFGAGSRVFKSNERQISQIAKTAGISFNRAKLLYRLIKYFEPKNILEIGTLAGYSSIVLARAAGTNSKVLTIEKETTHAEYARKSIEKANLSKNIEVVTSNAMDFIKNFAPENQLDLILLDADKSNYYKF